MENTTNEKKILISWHGQERLAQRLNIKEKDLQSYIERVWRTGKIIRDYAPGTKMRKYLEHISMNGGDNRAFKVKANTVFVFDYAGNTLLTCLNIPKAISQSPRN